MRKNDVWFVTGASKGLGLTLVKRLLEKGFQVAATSRRVEDLRSAVGTEDGKFLPLEADLADEATVKKAIDAAVSKFGTLDVIVNNAGYNQSGILETISDEEARKNFDINVFGLLNVLRNGLHILREKRSGTVVNISSIGGISIGRCNSIYGATKFAVEGLSEALASEMEPFGVKVIALKPGYFRTNFLNPLSLKLSDCPIEDYRQVMEARVVFVKSRDGQQPGDPIKLADVLIQMSAEDNPPLHLFLGSDTPQVVKNKFAAVLEDMEKWMEVTLSTDFSEKG